MGGVVSSSVSSFDFFCRTWWLNEAVDVTCHIAPAARPLAVDAAPGTDVRALDLCPVELVVDVWREVKHDERAAHRTPSAPDRRLSHLGVADVTASMSVGTGDRVT